MDSDVICSISLIQCSPHTQRFSRRPSKRSTKWVQTFFVFSLTTLYQHYNPLRVDALLIEPWFSTRRQLTSSWPHKCTLKTEAELPTGIFAMRNCCAAHCSGKQIWQPCEETFRHTPDCYCVRTCTQAYIMVAVYIMMTYEMR